MEENNFEQQITPTPIDPDRHTRLHRRPRSEADTKAKVSALFAESDLEEVTPVRREPVRREPVRRKPANPKPEAKPAAKPEAVKVAKPEAKPAVKPVAVKTAKPEAKPAVKPVAVKTAKPEAKPAAKPVAVKTAKPEAKPAAKPEAVKTAKPEAKPAAKPEAKRKLKPEVAQAKAEEPKNPEPAEAKKKSPRKIILTIIIIIAACGFLFSGYKLFTILHGYKEGSDAYKEVEHIVKPVPTPDKQEEEVFTVDVNALKELNSDAKGYLYCKDLLSYPVVQCEDNDYYLTHLFNGEWNSCGCLFIDCNLPEGFESRNCIIYGHNMNDGSMFASLYKYDDEEFYQQHKEFDVFTEGHHYIYKVLSLFVTPVDGFVYTYDFASDEDFVNFLNTAASYSPYETDHGELTPDRKVITMSTCLGNDDETQRFVVLLIRDREVTE